MQHSLNDVLDEQAVVSTNGLNSFGVHFVVLVGVCPEETCVSLLVDKKIREVDLFEL